MVQTTGAGQENKQNLSRERLAELNAHMKSFQPQEKEIYLKSKGKECKNLIAVTGLRNLKNRLSTSNLVKISDNAPLKPRSRAGGWSYVKVLPLLEIDHSIIEEDQALKFDAEVEEASKLDIDTLIARLAGAKKIPEKTQVVSSGYIRNADVVAFVLKMADGKCELCNEPAPFIKAANGTPYLEVHHWNFLSDDGEDTVENAGALCPNCHRRAHSGTDQEFIRKNRALPK